MYLIIGSIKSSKISCKISTLWLLFHIPSEENCACYEDETKMPCYVSHMVMILAQKCKNVMLFS